LKFVRVEGGAGFFTSLRNAPRPRQSEKPLFYFKEINLNLRLCRWLL
jgi:hypothetical protein